MKLRAELTTYKDTITQLGVNVTNGKCKGRVFVFLTLYVVTSINTAYFVFDKWSDIDNRIKGLKAITFYTLIVLYILFIIFKWSDTKMALDLIYGKPYPFPYHVTHGRRDLIKSINEDMITQNSFWRNAIYAYIVISILLPLLSVGKFMITTNKISNINVKELLLVFPIYYPKNYDTLWMYIIGYIVQTMFGFQLQQYGYFSTSAFASMIAVEGELKLLTLSVEEIDKNILYDNGLYVQDTCNQDYTELDSNERRNIVLQRFLQYFVNHHRATYKKIEQLNKGIQGVAFVLNFGVSIYICMALYNISQKHEILWKIQEAFDSFLWLYDIYCLDNISERIYTADENLRKALYNFSWFDKSRCFTRSLQIVMTRTTKPIEIRSLNLFVLSLKSYALCIRAAYSYYNLLNNLQNTPQA